MLKKICFTKDWILQKRQDLGNVDPTLLEKTILAFELLGRLCEQKIDFVFKGGTSLLLLLKDFRRLSIDVDILCDMPFEKFSHFFDGMVNAPPFVRWTEDPRSQSQIPKKHFKFYFQSAINSREDYILLDVLKGGTIFPGTILAPIELHLLKSEAAVEVKIPTLDGLIGDKLTAFAPSTVGIPYEEYRSMQIIKQLFDLGEMIPFAASIGEISGSYNAFLNAENNYRGKIYSRHETLQDTIQACYLLSQLGLRKGVKNAQTEILQNGIRQIGSHLINRRFTLGDAKIAASRTAYLAKILQADAPFEKETLRFDQTKLPQIRNVQLRDDLKILDRLKQILPEAFYYWHLFSRL